MRTDADTRKVEMTPHHPEEGGHLGTFLETPARPEIGSSVDCSEPEIVHTSLVNIHGACRCCLFTGFACCDCALS